MTLDELQAAILADATLKQYAIDGRDGDIVRGISPDTEPIEYRLTSLKVLDVFGPSRGAAIMQTLRGAAKSNPVLGEIVPHMDRDGVNIGHKDAGALLDSLVPSVLTSDEAGQLKALALRPIPITLEQVNKALRPLRNEGKAGARNWLGG